MKFISKKFTIIVSVDACNVISVDDWGDIPRLGSANLNSITRKDLIEFFDPADCEALDLVDPNRIERISNG